MNNEAKCLENAQTKRSDAARLGWKTRNGGKDVTTENELLFNGASYPKQRKLWDDESMIVAVEAVKDGLGVNRAAREYGVPHTTLNDRLSGRVEHGKKQGPAHI